MLFYANVSTETEHKLSFSVLHVKGSHADIESTGEFTASHVKWRVSSLSHVGPIIPKNQHHGAVLVYKELGHKRNFILQVFLSLNNDSEIKVMKQNGTTSQ